MSHVLRSALAAALMLATLTSGADAAPTTFTFTLTCKPNGVITAEVGLATIVNGTVNRLTSASLSCDGSASRSTRDRTTVRASGAAAGATNIYYEAIETAPIGAGCLGNPSIAAWIVDAEVYICYPPESAGGTLTIAKK